MDARALLSMWVRLILQDTWSPWGNFFRVCARQAAATFWQFWIQGSCMYLCVRVGVDLLFSSSAQSDT